MNIEKILDGISAAIGNFLPMLLSMFGHRSDVQKVQDIVSETCGFLPAAASVAAMFAAPNPIVTGVVGIATAICDAVHSSKVSRLVGSGLGTVNGVPIEGDWIKEK